MSRSRNYGHYDNYEVAKTNLQRQTAALLAERNQLQGRFATNQPPRSKARQTYAQSAAITPVALQKKADSNKTQEVVNKLQQIIKLCREQGSLSNQEMKEVIKVQNTVLNFLQKAHSEPQPNVVNPHFEQNASQVQNRNMYETQYQYKSPQPSYYEPEPQFRPTQQQIQNNTPVQNRNLYQTQYQYKNPQPSHYEPQPQFRMTQTQIQSTGQAQSRNLYQNQTQTQNQAQVQTQTHTQTQYQYKNPQPSHYEPQPQFRVTQTQIQRRITQQNQQSQSKIDSPEVLKSKRETSQNNPVVINHTWGKQQRSSHFSEDTLQFIAQIQRKALGEIIHLQQERDNLKKEKDMLLNQLQKVKAQAASNQQNITQRIHQQQQKLSRIKSVEIEKLVQQNNALRVGASESNRLVQENHQLAQEKSQLIQERNQLLQERTQIIQEKNQLILEKNQFIQQKSRIIPENNRVIPENSRLTQENNRLIPENNRLLTENNRLSQENKLLRQENQSLIQRIQHLEVTATQNMRQIRQLRETRQVRKTDLRETYPQYPEPKTGLAYGQYDSQIAVYQNQLKRATVVINELRYRLANVPGLQELHQQGERIRRQTTELLQIKAGRAIPGSHDSTLIRELQERLQEQERGKALFFQELKSFKQRYNELEQENRALKKSKVSFDPVPRLVGSTPRRESSPNRGIMKKRNNYFGEYEQTLNEMKKALH